MKAAAEPSRILTAHIPEPHNPNAIRRAARRQKMTVSAFVAAAAIKLASEVLEDALAKKAGRAA